MAIDINKLREKLNSLNNKTRKQDLIWKPKSGKTVIRILPYKFNKGGHSFIELLFHYDIGGKTYLSPESFGNPDPLNEFAKKLKSTQDKDDFALARKLQSKPRTYVPIVVRGEEDQGTKYWAFGKTVYSQLINIINDPDYGDITNEKLGHDISVTYKTAEELGKQYPETTIVAKPNKTPIVTDIELLKKIVDSQKEITDIFELLSYQELEDVLKQWLDLTTGEESNDKSTSNNDTYAEDDTETEQKPKQSSGTNSKASVASTSNTDDINSTFDSLFKNS